MVMPKSIGKVLAREAIIASCLAVISIALVWIAVPTNHHVEYFTTIFLKNPFPYFDSVIPALLYGAGVRIAFIVYPAYLLIRIIIWEAKKCKK